MIRNMVKVTTLAGVAGLLLVLGAAEAAGQKPVKEKVAFHAGWRVDKTTGGELCVVEPGGDECQPGTASSEPGGFESPGAVAVNVDPQSSHYRDVYVFDDVDSRVDDFASNGRLVGTFGWEVNKTKDGEAGASQVEKNVCTVASGDVCKAGIAGGAAGQLGNARGMAIDPANGNLYLAEYAGTGERIQEFTADGQFVLEVGRNVNGADKGNICTAAEETKGVVCEAPASSPAGPTGEQDAFSLESSTNTDSNQLTFGGPEGLLYVGEAGRVQVLLPDGRYKGELPLGFISTEPESHVSAIAVDPSGDLYLVYRAREKGADVIHELAPGGKAITGLPIAPEEHGGFIEVKGLAVDPNGGLGITEYEEYEDREKYLHWVYRGRLDNVIGETLRPVTEFDNPGDGGSSNQFGIHYIAFNDVGEMFATDFYFAPSYNILARELIGYKPVSVAEATIDPAGSSCQQGTDNQSDATFDCTLAGAVNPWGVTNTAAWFQWGLTPQLGQNTASIPICESSCGETPVTVSPGQIEGLPPNQTFYYRVAATDANLENAESVGSEIAPLKTQAVPPRTVGGLEASFERPFAADLSAMVNPENAETEYWFQYAPAKACEALEAEDKHAVTVSECPHSSDTDSLSSGEYGAVPAMLEASGLQPATSYRFRLFGKNKLGQQATNEAGGSKIPEGTFVTGPAPMPEAVSGVANDVGTTTATILGTVNPDGQRAAYQFQLGLYKGPETQFGVIFSGYAGAGAMPVEEALQLTNLQPGTTYAFRIVASSIFGTRYGEPVTFATGGLPEVIQPLPVLGMLPNAGTAFPGKGRRSRPMVTCRRHRGRPCIGAKHKRRHSRSRRAHRVGRRSTTKHHP